MPLTVDAIHLMSSRSNQRILSNVHLELADGTLTLLIGASGSGKTTLLECMAGLTAPTQGRVILDNSPILRHRRDASVAGRIAMMFQFPERQLYAPTVAKEFQSALKPLRLPPDLANRRRDKAMAAFGLNTHMLPESPLTASGGQRRRLAMAIGFARQPDWLLLDEPTAGLDAAATKLLLEAIRQHLSRVRAEGRGGIVIATHDLDALLPIADHVVMLRTGRVVDTCTSAQVYQNPLRLCAADIGLSPELETLLALQRTGLKWPDGPLSASDAADMIATAAKQPTVAEAALSSQSVSTDACNEADPVQAPFCHEVDANPSLPEGAESAPNSFAENLDPRAKLLFSTCVCIGVFVQSTPIGITIAILVALLSTWAARLSPRLFLKRIRPLLVLIVLSVIFAGISFHHGRHWWNAGWNAPGFWFAVRRMIILLAVLGIGSALSSSTTHLQFRRSLAFLLTPFARFGLPVAPISLASSLVLRFIPVVLQEARHCIKAAEASGRPTKGGRLRLRDTPAIVIPLVLTMLRFGEDVSLAMESRGFQLAPSHKPHDRGANLPYAPNGRNDKPSSQEKVNTGFVQNDGLRWRIVDTLIAFAGGLILAVFLVLN